MTGPTGIVVVEEEERKKKRSIKGRSRVSMIQKRSIYLDFEVGKAKGSKGWRG